MRLESMLPCVIGLALAACGARTPLDLGASDAAAGAAGSGGAAVGQDPCPSAVDGPKAMYLSCSTRDGRSRVRAPASPHTQWTTLLPTGEGGLGLSSIVADSKGNVYVATGNNLDSDGAFRRVKAATGAIAWTVPIRPSSATETPVILKTGAIELYAYNASSQDSVFSFQADTGASTSTTFGFELYYAPGNHAVGSDGSRYLVHSSGVGTANSHTFISRVSSSGTVTWTSADLASMLPPPTVEGMVSTSLIALGQNETVVVVIDVWGPEGSGGHALALAPGSGAKLWSTAFQGQPLGGPAVMPDGSIAIIAGPANAPRIVRFDPGSGSPVIAPVSLGLTKIFAVTRTGIILAGTNQGSGIDGIAAIASNGSALWTRSLDVRDATVDSEGMIVAFGKTITGLDAANGKTRWEYAAPGAGSCLAAAALTSDGKIVGLQCDATLFGAGD